MLGSLHDAEDALQDTLVRAWKGLSGFRAESPLRSWLHRIATNRCLSVIESRHRRVLPVDLGPGAPSEPREVTWLEPFPDAGALVPNEPAARLEQQEGLELAFVAALQFLPARQRAALVLRDVLGYSAKDAADVLDTNSTAVDSALQHARRTVRDRVPDRTQLQTRRDLGDPAMRDLVDRYVRAMSAADVEGVIALLRSDATWSMPPDLEWYTGHDAIAGFLVQGPFTREWRHRVIGSNGQPAVACYMWEPGTERFEGFAIDVLTLDHDGVSAITSFLDRSLFPLFGLPVWWSDDESGAAVGSS
jgi:RNA polymerase sigma-70 factor (ECF subfamily)